MKTTISQMPVVPLAVRPNHGTNAFKGRTHGKSVMAKHNRPVTVVPKSQLPTKGITLVAPLAMGAVTATTAATTTATTTAPVLPQAATIHTAFMSTPSGRSVWYLGGNQILKLLTSVDGDLDPDVLAKIAAVPSVVGDLALSVESLVSDDFTVGGFESDLLAQITSNTLSSKRGSSVAPPFTTATTSTPTTIAAPLSPTPPPAAFSTPASPSSPWMTAPLVPALDAAMTAATTSTMTAASTMTMAGTRATTPIHGDGAVPNPLGDYQPVPNPLARITPPASPLYSNALNLGTAAAAAVATHTTTTIEISNHKRKSPPAALPIEAR